MACTLTLGSRKSTSSPLARGSPAPRNVAESESAAPRLDSRHPEADNIRQMAAKSDRQRSRRRTVLARGATHPNGLSGVARRVLRYANRGLPRVDFLRRVSKVLMEFSGCDAVELRLKDPELQYSWKASRRPRESFRFTVLGNLRTASGQGERLRARHGRGSLDHFCRDVLRGPLKRIWSFSASQRSFWTGDAHESSVGDGARGATSAESYRSLAVMRFAVDDRTAGLLQLKSLRPDYFTREEVEAYEGFAQTLGLAIANRRGQWALRERVKELTCLYGIAQVAQHPRLTLEGILQSIAELLPPAWQYPEITTARILLDGRAFPTPNFREGPHRQAADIIVGGARRGVVEVFYTRDKAGFVEGVFLKEEQSLIDTVAREISLVVERREAEIYNSRLLDQLRHADRLATIGQLAAGVAHELNEPLANILGFAQLARKEPKMPSTSAGDLEKIVKTSLHAREIIHKLLVFSRQTPLQKTRVNLNQVVEEGLHFLETRCEKAGIELIRSLEPNLPEISADPSELQQVLVNLVVNALQALPRGGRLTIETHRGHDCVSLIVSDTGTGMTDDVKSKIFMPFFTTKDADQGTGLGLAVVHGIVTSHGGVIQVQSEAGRGSRFEVQMPLNNSGKAGKNG
jgi:two-component system NtrC family sensor kinase